MSVEFVDTNILIYAHEGTSGAKHTKAVELLERLFEEGSGAISTQVLSEFYSAATKKLRLSSAEAEAIMSDLGSWTIHRPTHAGLLKAAQLQRKNKLSWWDASIATSAQELGCSILWSENFTHGQRLGTVTVRNPFID